MRNLDSGKDSMTKRIEGSIYSVNHPQISLKAAGGEKRKLSDEEIALSQLVEAISETVRRVCGLGEFDRKLVAYYILATYSLDSAQTFPLLVFKGPMGTGKSRTMEAVGLFAYRPNSFSLRGRTLPTIRDELVASYGGTAIVEEADAAWKDGDGLFERMLSDRYAKSSAQAALKVPERGGRFSGFKTANMFFFGATVLHRRFPFADPALNGRSIVVRFRANKNRTYEDVREDVEDVQFARMLLKEMTLEPSEIPAPPGIAGRIFDTYKPVLSVAHMCEDNVFLKRTFVRLKLETVQLSEAQSIEPVAIVLRALVERLSLRNGGFEFSKFVKIRDLVELIRDGHCVQLRPHQV